LSGCFDVTIFFYCLRTEEYNFNSLQLRFVFWILDLDFDELDELKMKEQKDKMSK